MAEHDHTRSEPTAGAEAARTALADRLSTRWTLRQRVLYPILFFCAASLGLAALVLIEIRREFQTGFLPELRTLGELEASVIGYGFAVVQFADRPDQALRESAVSRGERTLGTLETLMALPAWHGGGLTEVEALPRMFSALHVDAIAVFDMGARLSDHRETLEDLEQAWRAAAGRTAVQGDSNAVVGPGPGARLIAVERLRAVVFDLLSEVREYLEAPNPGTIEEIREARAAIVEKVTIDPVFAASKALPSQPFEDVVARTEELLAHTDSIIELRERLSAKLTAFTTGVQAFELQIARTGQTVTDQAVLALDDGFVLVVLLVAGAVSIGGLLCWAAIGGALRRLETLNEAAGKLAEGDYTVRTGLRDGDEIGQVAQAFDRMASEIAASVDALRTLRERAEAANRAKSDFLAGMSHELRTPMNAIKGFTEAMQLGVFGPVDNQKYSEYLDHIQYSSSHMLGMLDQILEAARLGASSQKLVAAELSVSTIIGKIVAITEQSAGDAGIRIEVDLANASTVHGDERAVVQILLNLLSNAIKYSDPDTTVLIRCADTGGYLEISITDQGVGIAEEELGRVIDRYYRGAVLTKAGTDGTGLGLALTKDLVTIHGGELDLTSKLGEGTTARVRLPHRSVAPIAPRI